MYLTLHLHDVLTSCQDVIPFWFLSAAFFKKIMDHNRTAFPEARWLPPLWSQPLTDTHPCMPHRREGSKGVPLLSGKGLVTHTQWIMTTQWPGLNRTACLSLPYKLFPPPYGLPAPYEMPNCSPDSPSPLWIAWPPFPLESATNWFLWIISLHPSICPRISIQCQLWKWRHLQFPNQFIGGHMP